MKGLYVLKEERIYKRELPLWGSLLAAVLLAGCIHFTGPGASQTPLRTVLQGSRPSPC